MTRRGFWSQVARIWTTTLLIIVERPETAHSTLLGLSFLNKEMEMLLASTGSLNCLSKYIWKFPEQCLAHEKLSIGENCIYVYIQLIHFIVQQTLTQYCKATTPQLKKKKLATILFEANSVLCLERSMVHMLQFPSPRGVQSPQCGNHCPRALTLNKWGKRNNGSQGQLWKCPRRCHHSPPTSWSRRVFKALCSFTKGILRTNSISFLVSVSWAH